MRQPPGFLPTLPQDPSAPFHLPQTPALTLRRMTLHLRPLLLLAAFLPSCSAQTGQTQTGQTQTGQTQTGQTRTDQTRTQSGPSASSIPATPPASRRPARDPLSGLAFVNVAQLPREGQQLLTLIARGSPFRYSKDGVTFGNREGILPRQARGYYREYTVRTPGESDRGARRIVCGGQPVTNTAECYYTADHYASFRRIRP